jgi:hypothetical protein
MSHRWRSLNAAALLCVLAAALFAGCGSSGSDPEAPLSKAEYLQQGNQICTKGGQEKDQAVNGVLEEVPPNELAGGPSKETLKKLSEGALPFFQKVVTELAELQPPAEDKAVVEKFITELEAAAAKADANPLLIARSDPFSGAAEGARAYGLKDCNL